MQPQSEPAAAAAPQRPKPLRTCGQCGRQQRGMLQCARCRAAWYCGVDCQRAAWPVRADVDWCNLARCVCPMQSKGGFGRLFPACPGTNDSPCRGLLQEHKQACVPRGSRRQE